MIAAQESMTAKLCSFARAYHSISAVGAQKIFDDYLAYDLIGKEEYDEIGRLMKGDYAATPYAPRYGFESVWVFDEMNRFFSPTALSRIAFAERALYRYAADKAAVQYVVCGAGLDTFAFRNTADNIEIFELDHPDTQAYKLKRIHQLHWTLPDGAHYVPVDFAAGDTMRALLGAGFRPQVPSFFSLLGVTYYLTPDVLRAFVRDAAGLAAKGSRFVFDFPDETTFAEDRPPRVEALTEVTRKLGEPVVHGYTVAEIETILREEGFRIRIHETPDAIESQFFDGRSDHQHALENVHFVLAEKR